MIRIIPRAARRPDIRSLAIARVRAIAWALIVAACLATPWRPSPAMAEVGAPTVVELFTSQGCSSCPAADALLGELARRDDVLALSFHVDYWDNLGWRDPYASRANTERQRTYMRQLGTAYVYTPQMVIQGTADVSGADRAAVRAGIDAARRAPAAVVEVAAEPVAGGAARLKIAIAPAAGSAGNAELSAEVWLIGYDRVHVTAVARGENRGRELRNHNVVRQLTRLGSWPAGERAELSVALADGTGERPRWAVLVQVGDNGRILGAGRLP